MVWSNRWGGSDGIDGLGWMGKSWSRRQSELQPIGSYIGHIHHSDDRVAGNDVLHNYKYNYRDHVACIHVGHYHRGILGV